MDSDDVVDENCNNLSQLSFSDFDSSFVSSTPVKRKSKKPPAAPRNARGSRASEVQPSSFNFVAPVLFKCPVCPKKEYKLQRFYKQHMLSHKVKDAWSQIPDTNFLVKNGPTICNKAIESISEVVSFGEVAKKFKELIEKIKEVSDSEEWKKFCNRLCEHLTSTISSKKIMLPSTLWNNIFESIESISSGLEIRNHLKQMLFAALRISDSNVYSNAVEIFICDIVLYTGEQMLSFIRESIIGTRQVNLPVVSFDVEDRQTIHYVGGSIMHGFKKRGKAYSGNQEWQQILLVIDTKIDSASPGVQPPNDADREWTDDVDRGGLLIIGAKCMEVFMGIAAVVSSEIKADGSVPHEKVLDRVYSSPVPVLWDNMVACEEMSESLSLRFMNGVVKNFSQTYGRGLMRKKLNEVHEKPYASINLRHTVAPKSK